MIRTATRVFVYGTLKRGEANHSRLCADALSVEPAVCTGRLYHLRAGYPAMVEDEQGRVHGEAMTFADFESKLEELDRLEGYRPDTPETSLYVRSIRPIVLGSTGQEVLAHCYVWRRAIPEGARHVSSGRWTPASPGGRRRR